MTQASNSQPGGNKPKYLTLTQVCRKLNITDKTVKRLTKRGRFPRCYRDVADPRKRCWREDEVEQWSNEQRFIREDELEG